MKILLVKIKRQAVLGGTHYVYPPEYNPTKIRVVAYETSNTNNIEMVKARGDYEYLVGVVEDADATAFLTSVDITEISQSQAEITGATWVDQVVKITDEARIIEILGKVGDSQTITADDQKAIDPDDARVDGLSRSKTFAERLSVALL